MFQIILLHVYRYLNISDPPPWIVVCPGTYIRVSSKSCSILYYLHRGLRWDMLYSSGRRNIPENKVTPPPTWKGTDRQTLNRPNHVHVAPDGISVHGKISLVIPLDFLYHWRGWRVPSFTRCSPMLAQNILLKYNKRWKKDPTTAHKDTAVHGR